MLGDGHRRKGAHAAHEGRLVGRSSHQDTARHAAGPKDTLGKLPQFATAFADQGNDHDICRNPARKPRKERGFANAGPGKKTDSLAPHQRKKRIEDRNASRQSATQPAPCCSCRGRRAKRPGVRAPQQRPPVKWLPRRINHPANPAVIWCNLGLAEKLNAVINCHAVACGVRQDGAAVGEQPQDLSTSHTIAAVKHDAIANCDTFQPPNLCQATAGFHDATDTTHGDRPGDFGKQSIKNSGHGILPLFAAYRF
jgi:hypothetical protein